MMFILPIMLQSFFTSYSVVNSWLPIVLMGMVLSLSIVGVYYALGYAFNIGRMKQTAIREFGQVIGTGIIVVLLIAMLPIFTQIFTSMLPVANTTSTCTTLAGSSANIINGFPTNTVCSYVTQTVQPAAQVTPAAGADITPQLDYGLAATYVIVANMTNQTFENLNAVYTFSNWVGFLQTFTPTTTFCTPASCIDGTTKRLASIEYSYTPLAGYDLVTLALRPVQTQALFMTEIFITQLLFIAIFLFAWPYLLAAGMILRATVFGRGLGGLLIAAAIVGLIVFPFVYIIEYTVLTNPSTLPIGVINPTANALPSNTMSFNGLAIVELPLSDSWTGANTVISGSTLYNFTPFVFPKLDRVIYNDGCWPDAPTSASSILAWSINGKYTSVPLIAAEGVFAGYYLIPGVGAATGLLNLGASALGLSSSIPAVPTTCTPSNLLNTYFGILNVYGVEAILGIFIPVLNILIALTAVRGISGMLGGSTNILGIGRLL